MSRLRIVVRALHRSAQWTARQFASHAAADFYVAAAVVAATTAIGIVTDDALPVGSAARPPHWWRILIAVGAIVLLALAVVWRRSKVRARGTFFYVTLLTPGMRDYYHAAATYVSREHIHFRQHIRQIGTDFSCAVWDARREVVELAHELTASCNEDDQATGNTLAPNCLWPASLALGYEWRPGRAFVLREFSESDDEHPVNLSSTLDLSSAVDLALHAAASLPGAHPNLTKNSTHNTDCFALDGLVTREWPTPAPDAVHKLLLDIQVSDKSSTTAQTLQSVTIPIGQRTIRVDRRRSIGVDDGQDGFRPVTFGKVSSAADSPLTPEGVAARIAFEIVKARLEHPDATILMACRAPKSVVLGAGVCLRAIVNEYCRSLRREHTVDVWGRLLLLNFDEPRRTNVPAWTHPEQNDPEALLR